MKHSDNTAPDGISVVSQIVRLRVSALQESVPGLTPELWEIALSRVSGIEIDQPGEEYIYIKMDQHRCGEPFCYFWSDLVPVAMVLAR